MTNNDFAFAFFSTMVAGMTVIYFTIEGIHWLLR